MSDNVLRVRCIDNEKCRLYLTLGKEYELINEKEDLYLIRDNSDTEEWYLKELFKIVKEDKQVKEYSFEEVIANIEESETYECTDNIYYIKKITRNGIGVIFNDGEPIERCGINDRQRFIKVQEPVSFNDILNSDGKCKVEFGSYNSAGYKYFSDVVIDLIDKYGGTGLKKVIKGGKWYLESEVEE